MDIIYCSMPRKRGRPRSNNTDARLQRMIELRTQGSTLADIGKEYGISKERVRQILLPLGKLKPSKIDPLANAT